MAALHVHTVKASLTGQLGGRLKGGGEAVQLVVGQDAAAVQGSVLQGRAVVADHRIRHAGGLGVTAGVGGLHHHNGLEAVVLHAGFLDVGHQTLEIIQVLFGQLQLMRAGTAFGHGRHGLEPDQARAAFGETLIAAPGQLAGGAVFQTVGALHGLQRDAVGGGVLAQRQRLEQGRQILLHGQECAKLPSLLLDFLHGMIVILLVIHARSSPLCMRFDSPWAAVYSKCLHYTTFQRRIQSVYGDFSGFPVLDRGVFPC